MAIWVSYSEVKAQVTFQQVFEHYALLDGALPDDKGEIAICCPFHEGRSRTLKANDTKHGFKCFSPECDKQGNVITFAEAMEGLSFRDAALFLQSTFMKPTGQPPEETSNTKAASDVAEAVNEPRKTPPDEVAEVVNSEVAEKTPLETPEKPPQATTDKAKGKGYMREVEATLRDLLHEGDDEATIKWVKSELYAS